MKYYINGSGKLMIYNDYDKFIFMINKNKYWAKWDFNQHGEEIFYGNSKGIIVNRKR